MPVLDDPEYQANHRRVRKVRGDARFLPCVDCKVCDSTWSHIKDTDKTDPDNYEPRCYSCHGKYDYTDERRTKLSATMAEKNGKLTAEDVLEIRRLYASGKISNQHTLARMYGISHPYVNGILHRRKWKHI